MASLLRISIVVLIAAVIGMAPFSPASAGCTGFSGTADGFDRETAITRAQAAVASAVAGFKAEKKLGAITVSGMRAKPQPYWRDSVSADLFRGPPIVKSNSYTICWTGVVSPYVCTAGAKVCW
ncbi:MAG: hypothetical protein MUO41_02680 [Methyloceanibacter sp.]|nr:hypothetical protein [Methyloceanibacter sp.]